MRRNVILLVVGLGGLVAVGAGLWLLEGMRRPPPAQRPEERLLIGFDPGRVERVRLVMGDARVDRKRQQGEWIPMAGSPDSGVAIRMDAVLEQLATLRARLVLEDETKRGKALPEKDALAEISVWRGGVRPLRLSFFPRGRKVAVRTSDRPGLYEVDPGVLDLIRRELRQVSLAPALTSTQEEVKGLRIQHKDKSVRITRRGGRWFLEDGPTLGTADSAAVGRLMRMLLDLRIREQLGQGDAARAKHGLGTPHYTVSLEAEKPHRLLLGGPCPRDPSGRLAALGPTADTVACVGPVDEALLGASLASDRIFGPGADEIQAVTIQRGSTTLAMLNRPGGGWSMISPSEASVDQGAAQRLVTELSELRRRRDAEGDPPGDDARPLGRIKVTPLVGEPEALEFFGEGKGAEARWARREGGGRWVALPDEADALLLSDPVVLRSHDLCQFTPEDLLAVLRSQDGGPSELSLLEGGIWQLILLQGRRSVTEAAKIGASLERYRSAARTGERPAEGEWKPPVLLLEEGDAELRDALLFQLGNLRAKAFVAARATRAHGLERGALFLSALHRHNCREEDGKKKCDVARCELELGGPVKGGGCYGRVPSDGAVFVATQALCEISRRPLASRRVYDTPLHGLTGVTLTAGPKQVSFAPKEGSDWQRADGKPLPDGSLSDALLSLAPLQAEAVATYGRAGRGAPVLSASLSQPQVAPVQLRFYETSAGDFYDVRRGDRPVTYRVPAAPVKKLLALLKAM